MKQIDKFNKMQSISGSSEQMAFRWMMVEMFELLDIEYDFELLCKEMF